MLHRLERAHRGAELHTIADIADRRVDCALHHTDEVGRDDRVGQRVEPRSIIFGQRDVAKRRCVGTAARVDGTHHPCAIERRKLITHDLAPAQPIRRRRRAARGSRAPNPTQHTA